jgi:hypothetical protein
MLYPSLQRYDNISYKVLLSDASLVMHCIVTALYAFHVNFDYTCDSKH